jgi:hypothetical protein
MQNIAQYCQLESPGFEKKVIFFEIRKNDPPFLNIFTGSGGSSIWGVADA